MERSGVIVVGSLNMDLINYVNQFPVPGETLSGLSYKTSVGGKGANQAAMAGLLGETCVDMVGCVGGDSFGDKILEKLREKGVFVEHVETVKSKQTGVATITVDSKGENTIILFPGANHGWTVDQMQGFDDLLGHRRILVCQNEIDVTTTVQALQRGKAAGLITILNPAPAISNPPEDLLANVDVLIPNETEAARLLGTPDLQFTQVSDFEDAAKNLMEKFTNVQVLVVSAGARGAVLLTRLNPTQPMWISPPPVSKEAVIDTTGAGDALIGSLAWSLAQSFSSGEAFHSRTSDVLVVKAVTIGCAAAAQSIQKQGCQESYPSKEDLQDYLLD